MVLDQAHERLDEPRATPARDRHASFLDGKADDLGHEARAGRIGPEARVQHPGRQHAVRALRGEGRPQPVAARCEHGAGELDQATGAEPPKGSVGELQPVPRPQLRPEHAEGQVSVGPERLDHSAPLRPELGLVRLGGAQQKRSFALREECRRRQLGVQVLEVPLGQLRTELRVRSAPHPERMPRAEDIVQVARLGQLRGANRAAQRLLTLEHEHAPAGPGEQSSAGKGVDSAPDQDRVVLNRPRAHGTPRRSRAHACGRPAL